MKTHHGGLLAVALMLAVEGCAPTPLRAGLASQVFARSRTASKDKDRWSHAWRPRGVGRAFKKSVGGRNLAGGFDSRPPPWFFEHESCALAAPVTRKRSKSDARDGAPVKRGKQGSRPATG